MTPNLSYHHSVTPHLNPAAAHKKEHASFSRPSHFALILLPVMLGVAYSMTQDTAMTAPRFLLVVSLFTLGLGASLMLLHGVKKVEEWDEAHTSKRA